MKMKIIFNTLLLIISVMAHHCVSDDSCPGKQDEPKIAPPPKHYNILLMGATGDLARKYLWNGLFSLFKRHYMKGTTAFNIYACGTSKPDVGRQKLSDILLNVIQCELEEPVDCRQLKTDFVAITQYHQAKTAEHYQKLADKIHENSRSQYGLQDTERTSEEGRLVYLSIPPSQYTKATKLINKYLRPTLGRPWFRVVLEKPFGHDKDSAVKLSKHLVALFKEEEIYRVDHYLGKPIVKTILPFRQVNRHLYEPIWNRNHIERVEVVMKETLDCKGRTEFYNEVGVIRDVMQNHLTEVMTLIAMELPEMDANINTILVKKQQVLKDILPLDITSTVIGQYETYATEVLIESNQTEDRNNNDYTEETFTRIPTFAASVLFINNARWRDVPFVLISGKKLDEKASYVRVIFKNNKMCLANNDPKCNNHNQGGQIVFLISSNDVKVPPMISISKRILNDRILNPQTNTKPKSTLGWKLADWKLDFEVVGENLSTAYQLIADSHQTDAYTVLIEGVYEGQRHLFTNTANLLASWNIWSDLVKELNLAEKSLPRKYLGKGVDSHVLDFRVIGNKVEFVLGDENLINVIGEDSDRNRLVGQIASDFRGQKLVVKPVDKLFEYLALAIESSALNSVDERGVFHLAFPGGYSPRPIVKYLSHHLPLFPWKQTHIWQVDERCVDSKSRDSNFKIIQDYLLNYINIPFNNVHPMPVHLLEDLCDSKYNGDLLYEAVIKRNVLNHTLDFIVLGMGKDGHVASLFPNEDIVINNQNDKSDNNRVKLIQFVDVRNTKVISPKRMTMTLSLINSARNVSILATGKIKHPVLAEISKLYDPPNIQETPEYPITMVRSEKGHVVWYIDNDAYFG